MHEVLAAPCDPAAGQTLLSRGDAHKPRVDPPRLSAQPSNKSPSVEGRYGQNPEAFFGLGSQWGSERAKERVCTHFFMLTKNLMIIQIYHNWNIFFCKINVFSMLIQIVCVCVCVCVCVLCFCVCHMLILRRTSRQDTSCAENTFLFAHGSEILPKRLCANKANSKLH